MIATPPPTATKRADTKPALDLSPVQFLVIRPMFFRGEAVPAGANITADLHEAVDLNGNPHVEMASPADAKRIREANDLACAVLDRAAGVPRTGSWATGWAR